MPDLRHVIGAVAALAAVLVFRRIVLKPRRHRHRLVRPDAERVLILGASSGLGRTLARQYAARGARVCVVARRVDPLTQLAQECGEQCLPFVADFAEPADMARLRAELLRRWAGLDTLHVCAGVSAVQPVMALAGVDPSSSSLDDPDVAGVQQAAQIAARAAQGNFFGPLVAAITFLPLLRRSSRAPAVLLVSSLAAVVPAPTRALYAATKAASLLFFQSLAIEHPDVAFTCVLPATIEGNFRASAVDAHVHRTTNSAANNDGDGNGNTTATEYNKKGLKLEYVARRCVDAVDCGQTGSLVVPWLPYALAHHLYYLWPALIEAKAREKYHFSA